MRIMAIDPGDARTGVAFSDLTATLVGDAFTISAPPGRKLLDLLCAEARERGVTRIVVGMPLNMNGEKGERAEKSAALADRLSKASGLPVALWDERRTTVDAARILHTAGKHGKKNKGAVDAVAAALILEGYMAFIGGK